MISGKQPIRCSRCGGKCYSDYPKDESSDIWCFSCGEWIPPPGWTPSAYVPRLDEQHVDYTWRVDSHGNIIDEVDDKVEALLHENKLLTVSSVAKRIHCSNGDARISLERLVRVGLADRIRYGPQERWIGFIKKGVTYAEYVES